MANEAFQPREREAAPLDDEIDIDQFVVPSPSHHGEYIARSTRTLACPCASQPRAPIMPVVPSNNGLSLSIRRFAMCSITFRFEKEDGSSGPEINTLREGNDDGRSIEPRDSLGSSIARAKKKI